MRVNCGVDSDDDDDDDDESTDDDDDGDDDDNQWKVEEIFDHRRVHHGKNDVEKEWRVLWADCDDLGPSGSTRHLGEHNTTWEKIGQFVEGNDVTGELIAYEIKRVQKKMRKKGLQPPGANELRASVTNRLIEEGAQPRRGEGGEG